MDIINILAVFIGSCIIMFIAVTPVAMIMYFTDKEFDGSGFGPYGYSLVKLLNCMHLRK